MEFNNLLTLIKTVSDSELTGFKYEENGVKINLSKEQNVIASQVTGVQAGNEAAFAPVMESAAADRTEPGMALAAAGKVMQSPLVGTFYSAPSEDVDNFVAVGDRVRKGQTLAIVEAMKLMNEIESEYDGTIVEILAENGQAVEYGQPLFRIEE